jgi:hypothetical protein
VALSSTRLICEPIGAGALELDHLRGAGLCEGRANGPSDQADDGGEDDDGESEVGGDDEEHLVSP